jgi:hypothetical protein
MATDLDARSLLAPLVGQQILTVRGRPNAVLGLTDADVIVGTDRSPDGELVPIEAVQSGLERLLEAGELEVHPRSLSYRSSFVGAVLLTLPGAVVLPTSPPRIRLTDPMTAYRVTEAGHVNEWWAGDSRQRFWLEITDRRDIGVDLHCPQRDADGNRTPGYSLIWWVQTEDIVFHYDKHAHAITSWSRAAGPVTEAPTVWLSHRATTRRRLLQERAQPGWWLDLDGPFPLDPPLTLAQIRESALALRTMLEALRAEHPGSLYFPFSFYGGIEPRPQQPYLNKLPVEFVELFPSLSVAAELASPSVANQGEATTPTLGMPYRQAQVSPLPTERQPFTVDPALVERGLRGTPTLKTSWLKCCDGPVFNRGPGTISASQTSILPGRQTEQSSSPRSRASPTTTKNSNSGLASARSCATASAFRLSAISAWRLCSCRSDPPATLLGGACAMSSA